MIKTLRDYRFTGYENLSDLVNGLHLVITYRPKVFSYGDAYEALPKIVKNLYFACCKDKVTIPIWSKAPDAKHLQLTFMQGDLLVVASIAPHITTPDKVHTHLWVYGLQDSKLSFHEWWDTFDRNMRKEKYISSSGNPIFVEPVKDQIDDLLRDSGNEMSSYYEPIVQYIKKKSSNNLMGYFRQKNNPHFLYHYSK